MKCRIAFFFIVLSFASCSPEPKETGRLTTTVNPGWTFQYLPYSELDTALMQPGYDDSEWQAIGLPHTWSTYETTGEVHPFILNASERDDSYWWYGWGYYRKKFSIDPSMKGKKFFVEFDGVQKYSKVYLNGHFLGDHKGGFTGFYFDLTDYLNWDGENVLAVGVSTRRNDRHRIPPMTAGNWNVYGGIYRDVRLVVKNRVHIPFQGSYKHEGGTFVTTPRVSAESADVIVRTWVMNEMDNAQSVELLTSMYNPSGKLVQKQTQTREIASGKLAEFVQSIDNVNKPLLWSPGTPNLYKVVSQVFVDGTQVDQYESPLGFRFFRWDYENDDLYVNGERLNILGTNRHQEYPWLGDAHPKWMARMDMEDIKFNLGHNFMRLTHYPNDNYLYQLADSFGIVMVEEVPNIKSIDFDEEVQEQNVREMIRRDRNHPSIFFWSMGNETSDAADSRWAVEEDTTRIIHLRKGEQGGDFVQHTHENLDMENLLRVTVRGWFDKDDAPAGFNAEPENGQHSSTETWQHQMARIRGGSVRGLLGDNCMAWLYEDHGADREYLNCILKHINPKGWVDMYRVPKYIYWLTRANYTDNPVLFIHPHFWRSAYAGQSKNIQVDSNCDEVELFVNGKSIGKRNPSRETFNTVTFEDVTVTPGILKAVGRKDGRKHTSEVVMPGAPAKIVLTSSHKSLVADRSGIAIVMANILDKEDNPVFDARNTLKWSVTGPGKLVGAEIYESDIMKHEEMSGTGYTVVPVGNLVRTTTIPGKIKVSVASEGLESAEIEIRSVAPEKKPFWITEPVLSDAGRKSPVRIPGFTGDMKEIPLTILPITQNSTMEGKTVKEIIPELNRFISERNYGNFNRYVAYPYLIRALANRMESMNGYLIADDYNFYIARYNELVVMEDKIRQEQMSDPEKKAILEGLADKVLIQGNDPDLEGMLEIWKKPR